MFMRWAPFWQWPNNNTSIIELESKHILNDSQGSFHCDWIESRIVMNITIDQQTWWGWDWVNWTHFYELWSGILPFHANLTIVDCVAAMDEKILLLTFSSGLLSESNVCAAYSFSRLLEMFLFVFIYGPLVV